MNARNKHHRSKPEQILVDRILGEGDLVADEFLLLGFVLCSRVFQMRADVLVGLQELFLLLLEFRFEFSVSSGETSIFVLHLSHEPRNALEKI
jgi:hypothetical protein